MKHMKKTISLLLTLMMLMSLGCFTAFAQDGDIDQPVKIEEGQSGDTNITIGLGDNKKSETFKAEAKTMETCPTISFEPATEAQGGTPATPDTVTVNGNINIDGETTTDGLSVTATGNSVKVVAKGNITSTGKGIEAFSLSNGSTEITVTGSVTSTGGDVGIIAKGNSTVTVKKGNAENTGSVSGYTGIVAQNGSTVTAEGDAISTSKVSFAGYGVSANGGDNNAETTVIVGGYLDENGNVKASSTGGSVTGKFAGVEASNNGVVYVKKGSAENSGNVTGGNGVIANDGGIVFIDGNVEAASGIGITSFDTGTKVTVGGTVTGKETGVSAYEGSTVTVEGSVTGTGKDGVMGTQGSTVMVEGNVTGARGVEALYGATVTVEGMITGTAKEGVLVSNGGTVMVGGNVIGGVGDEAGTENSALRSSGTEEPKTAGVVVAINAGDAKSKIVVEGTVSGDNAISLQIPVGADLNSVKSALPEIVVQTLNPTADMVAVVGDNVNASDASDITNAVLDQVKYIVDTDVNTTQADNLVVEVYRLTEDGSRTALNTESVNGKNLTVATTGTKLIVSAKSGSLVGIAITVDNSYSETNTDGNKVEYDKASGQYIITVGIGGGLKFIATPKTEPENEEPVKPDNPKPEEKPKEENTETEATAVNNNAFSLDYKNHILTTDMTNTRIRTILADTLRRFQKDGFENFVIKVANGSFTVAMDDLIQMIGTAPSFTLKASGDTLTISVGGNEVATLVMT